MKKKLAIISANDLQLPLVNKAKEMGIETHCFSWDKTAEHTVCREIADYFHPISILEKELILEKCKEIGIDGVISICSDISMPMVAYVAQGMGLIGNRYEDTLIMRNKYKVRQAFFKNGVSQPRFTIASKGQNPDLTGFQFPLIVKPTDRCSSVGIKKANNDAELKEAILRAQQLAYSQEAIIEEFVSGCEATVDIIAWQGKHYPITISDTETTGAPYFSKIGYHQPSMLDQDIQAKIIDEAKKALTALNLNYGASDTEVKITENGEVKIIEINPRMGGDATEHLLRFSKGYDFIKGVINVALNQFEEPVFPLNKYSGVCYLSKETEYLKPIMENKENEPDIVMVKIDTDELKYLQCGGDRSGFLIYQSEQRRNWKK